MQRRSRIKEHRIKVLLRHNALSLVLIGLFLVMVLAQIYFGRIAYNEERLLRGQQAVHLLAYLQSGHFIEALFENWESEFLQMGAFVLIAVKLRQKGSTESKPFVDDFDGDDDPREEKYNPRAPWPVRRGGWVLAVYEHSLSLAYGLLFALSFVMHAVGGRMLGNEERLAHGQPAQTLLQFASSSEFWFESFQNWQSEFLAIASVVIFTIFLRERGSPQSKPVAAAHSRTGA